MCEFTLTAPQRTRNIRGDRSCVRHIVSALEETEYASKLRAAGFTGVEVEPWRIYKIDAQHRILVARQVPAPSMCLRKAAIRSSRDMIYL